MKVGDLVRYRHWHDKLQHLRGVVIKIKKIRSGDRAQVLWNRDPQIEEVMDWVEDLEVVNEGG